MIDLIFIEIGVSMSKTLHFNLKIKQNYIILNSNLKIIINYFFDI